MRTGVRGLPAHWRLVATAMTVLGAGVGVWSATRASTAAPPPPTRPGVVLAPLATGPACLIQSTIGTEVAGNVGNFEVVVQQGSDLVHYWHGNAEAGLAWQRAQTITSAATGPGCLIQSTLTSAPGAPGNLEVVVPEGDHLTHYTADSSRPGSAWTRGQSFGTHVTGQPSLIQSTLGTTARGSFEVVVTEGSDLVHYTHDNANPANPWVRVGTVAAGVTAGGTLVQSDYRSGTKGRLEVLANIGGRAVHLWKDPTLATNPWNRGGTFASDVTGVPALIQSRLATGTHGRFEAVTRQGGSLVHWFHDNNVVTNPWTRGLTVTTEASSSASLIHSRLPSGPGNFELVVLSGRPAVGAGERVRGEVTDHDLVHFFHDNTLALNPWRRAQTITFRGRSEKVCQLTGGRDKERNVVTTNDTATASDFGYTDIGYPVEAPDGRLKLYFGDSRDSANRDKQRTGVAPEVLPDDAVGISTDTTPPSWTRCLRVAIAEGADGRWAPLQVTPTNDSPGPFRQGLFNVPASGFTIGSAEYTIFFTDHCAAVDTAGNCTSASPGTNATGRSAITRNTGDTTFQELRTLPAPFNAATAALNSDQVAGIPDAQKQGVYVWAVDRYRKGTPRLANIPAGAIDDPAAWRYLAGVDKDGNPQWSPSATAATPVYGTGDPAGGCVGEMHVTWVAPLGRWVMLYNCLIDQQAGLAVVRARTATAPWGPWSEPTEIFHPGTDGGWCRWLHKPAIPACDRLGADNRTPLLTAAEGSPYGPYVLDRFTRATPEGAELTFLLSTWNPYQVVVMRTTLTASL